MAIPNLWRTKEQRYRLQGDVCPACHKPAFPPKQVCPHCHYGAVTPVESHHDYHYVLLFDRVQSAELSVAGDD
ncbi:MAG: hypothetical protein R2867_02880 [Caldilineaceae bacterium]